MYTPLFEALFFLSQENLRARGVHKLLHTSKVQKLFFGLIFYHAYMLEDVIIVTETISMRSMLSNSLFLLCFWLLTDLNVTGKDYISVGLKLLNETKINVEYI